MQKKSENLTKKQKTNINKFIIASSLMVFSGIFFGNIDRVMLGKFVSGEFIGYYTASLSLVGAIISIIGFSGAALFPIFSKLKGKRLNTGLKKSLRITFFISLIFFIITIIFSQIVVSIVYGKNYSPSINLLRLFSFLVPIISLSSIYQIYYFSQGKPQKTAKLLFMSTILNIILNYVLITSLLKFGQMASVYGATIATIISQGFYLAGLRVGKRG
jgi:O-antigen/teichoic acid export membrane protein